jgi:hypothetical protein
MDVIKLLIDSNYEMGFNDLGNTPYGDLASVLNEIGNRVANANLNMSYTPNDGHDWRRGCFISGGRGGCKVEHLIHPLWNVEDQEQRDGFKAQDSFSLSRVVKQNPIPITSTTATNNSVSSSANDTSASSCGNLS